MYDYGKSVQRVEMQSELDRARQVQAEIADELELAKAERQVVYRDRVRVVEREADPSGCADVRLPSGMLDALGGSRD